MNFFIQLQQFYDNLIELIEFNKQYNTIKIEQVTNISLNIKNS